MNTPSKNKNRKMRRFISLSIMGAIAATSTALLVTTLLKTPIKDPVRVGEQSTVTAPPATAPQPEPQTAPVQKQTVKVYWLSGSDKNAQLVAAPLEIQTKSDEKAESLQKALETLLSGSTPEGYVTTIPQGTKLLSIKVKKDGVHLNLSQEFTSGGGSSDMSHRLAQILYTATSISADTPVWLNVDGTPLEALGGEGLVLNQPITRKYFEENFTL